MGGSEPMLRLRTRLLKVAGTKVSVLLTGETGTGKSTAARWLHLLSQRAQGPLVKVNCAGIPDSLLESELFGHERGAFTGAHQRRDGLLAQAHGGTLFLDEIGELSLAGQAKLLTTLDDGEVRPVGGARATPLDLRILSATSRDLNQGMREGSFRADLFHRVAVLHLHFPPLRERGDDVARLARQELSRLARRHGRSAPQLAPCAHAFLKAHPWPGNVRELSHRLEAALLLLEGEVLDGEGLRDASPLDFQG
jgi:DNA-binding NtrC family response regulator